MRRFFWHAVLTLGLGALAFPALGDQSSQSSATSDDPHSITSLDLPKRSEAPDPNLGANACHMCEWRPHPFVLPAAEECGVAADGTPNQGVFNCGWERNCDKRCDFVKCQGS